MRGDEPQWPIGAMAYTDAGGNLDIRRAPAVIVDLQRALGEEYGDGVVGAGDAEMAGEPSGAGNGGHRTDEHAAGRAVRFSGDVQALVNPVDKVDVGVAGRAIDDFGAGGDAAGGVGGLIGQAEIGFHFGNGGGHAAMHKHLPKQRAGDGHRVTRVEGGWQDRSWAARAQWVD